MQADNVPQCPVWFSTNHEIYKRINDERNTGTVWNLSRQEVFPSVRESPEGGDRKKEHSSRKLPKTPSIPTISRPRRPFNKGWGDKLNKALQVLIRAPFMHCSDKLNMDSLHGPPAASSKVDGT
jgi:hypothetical protein